MSETVAASAFDAHCPYCGMSHSTLGKCPLVKAYEYHQDGTIKRVEFFAAGERAAPVYRVTYPEGCSPLDSPAAFALSQLKT